MKAQDKISIRGQFFYPLSGWKHSLPVRWLLFLALAAMFYLPLWNHLIPRTYDLKVGMEADKTILAPRQIEDAEATQKAKDLAAQQVQPVYTIVSLRNETLTEKIFNRMGQINGDNELAFSDKVMVYRNELPQLFRDFSETSYQNVQRSGQYGDGLPNEMNRTLNEQQYRIPEEAYFKLARLSQEDIAAMKPVAAELVKRLAADPIADAQAARAKVPEMVNSSSLVKNTTRELVQEIVRFAITPNKFFNENATVEARTKARENTPIVYTKKNEVLVQQGDKITEDTYRKLADLDLLKRGTNYFPYLGLLLVVSMLTLSLYWYTRHSQLSIKTDNQQMMIFVLIYFLNLSAMEIVSFVQNANHPSVAFLAPVSMGIMLITILLHRSLALISSFLFSIMASVIFNLENGQLFDFRYGFVTIVISMAAIFTINQAKERSTVLKAGLFVSFFGMLAVEALQFLSWPSEGLPFKEILFPLVFAAIGGLLTAVLVIGLLPFFEAVFGILSPLKLIELSNPNHPLLRKLLTETPGTYHHSVMVGNLSEAAAEAIGANGLLCRVGAFYHDIGKTRRPSYFIENQMGMDNPHDQIDPELSKSIIVSHVKDGVEMLKDHKLPKPIRDIAEQHHGTTLLKYFYHKANKIREEKGEESVSEEHYRYPGPKAQSKEAAIVGISDSVEAAVRSLRNPSVEQIDALLRKIVKDRLDDGQFEECDLTMKELNAIVRTLKETLLGIFHSRIEYPADAPEKPATFKGA